MSIAHITIEIDDTTNEASIMITGDEEGSAVTMANNMVTETLKPDIYRDVTCEKVEVN